jgi:hypothetical protein
MGRWRGCVGSRGKDGAAAGRRRGCIGQRGYEEVARQRDCWVHELTDEEVLHYIPA